MSSEVTLTWSEFLREAQQFLEISEKLSDTWEIMQKNKSEGGTFLIYKQKIPFSPSSKTESDTLEFLQIEYHVIYSISYQVPMLFFQAHKSDGSLLSLEHAWHIFEDFSSSEEKSRSEMLSILTQMEHPHLYKPFLALHPCRTAALLAQGGASSNRILTFISLVGPFVQLNLQNSYGLENNLTH